MYASTASVIFFSSIILFCFSNVDFHLYLVCYLCVHCVCDKIVEGSAETLVKIVLAFAVCIVGILYYLYIFVIFYHDAVVGMKNC